MSTAVLCVFVRVRLTEHGKRGRGLLKENSYILSFVLKVFEQKKARTFSKCP